MSSKAIIEEEIVEDEIPEEVYETYELNDSIILKEINDIYKTMVPTNFNLFNPSGIPYPNKIDTKIISSSILLPGEYATAQAAIASAAAGAEEYATAQAAIASAAAAAECAEAYAAADAAAIAAAYAQDEEFVMAGVAKFTSKQAQYDVKKQVENKIESEKVNDEKKQYYKQKAYGYIPLINSDMFNKDKLNVRQKGDFTNIGTNNIEKFVPIVPTYHYNSKNEELLVIQTPFIDVNKKNIMYNQNFGIYSSPSKKFTMRFTAKILGDSIIKSLIEYDAKVSQYIKEVYANNILCSSRIISNINPADNINLDVLDELKPIHCKINQDNNFKEYSKLISYNISKKYDRIEEFNFIKSDCSNLKRTFDRILTDKKQMRMLLTPKTYLNLTDKVFYSFVNIIMMEVKYNGAKIYSPLDKNETNIKPEMTTKITI